MHYKVNTCFVLTMLHSFPHPSPTSLPLKVEECTAEVERVVQERERSRVEHEQQISDLASTLQMYQVCTYMHIVNAHTHEYHKSIT